MKLLKMLGFLFLGLVRVFDLFGVVFFLLGVEVMGLLGLFVGDICTFLCELSLGVVTLRATLFFILLLAIVVKNS